MDKENKWWAIMQPDKHAERPAAVMFVCLFFLVGSFSRANVVYMHDERIRLSARN